MKVQIELAKTNLYLLEAGTSFKFNDIYIEVVEYPGLSYVEIRKAGKLYDKNSRLFVSMINNSAMVDGKPIYGVDCQFKSVYEAFKVVMELLK